MKECLYGIPILNIYHIYSSIYNTYFILIFKSAIIGIYVYDKERKIILKDNVDYTNKLDKKYNLDTNYLAISFIKLLVIDDGTVVETAIKKVN